MNGYGESVAQFSGRSVWLLLAVLVTLRQFALPYIWVVGFATHSDFGKRCIPLIEGPAMGAFFVTYLLAVKTSILYVGISLVALLCVWLGWLNRATLWQDLIGLLLGVVWTACVWKVPHQIAMSFRQL